MGVVIPGVAATVVLTRNGRELATWALEMPENGYLAAIDELARLQLAAQRLGCRIGVRQAPPQLMALLRLVGLVEVIGEAEGGEQVGVEEVVEPDDPIA